MKLGPETPNSKRNVTALYKIGFIFEFFLLTLFTLDLEVSITQKNCSKEKKKQKNKNKSKRARPTKNNLKPMHNRNITSSEWKCIL